MNNLGYRKILKYTLAFGGIQGLGALISLIRNKVTSVILGPSGMGVISLFQSSLQMMENSTNFGISQSGVRDVSAAIETAEQEDGTLTTEVSDQIKLVRSWSLVTAMLGLLATLAFAPLINRAMGEVKALAHPVSHYYWLLAPIVAIVAVNGGELVVLRATRHLKAVAQLNLLTAIPTLLLSVPIYYLWGVEGIAPALLLITIAQTCITLAFSYRLYPPQFDLSPAFLRKGRTMITLGLAFVASGLFGSGAEFVIRTFLNHQSGEATVGLYNVAFTMSMTYAGMIFAVLDSEYFPRLSTLCAAAEKREIRDTILRQIKVMAGLVSLMVIVVIPIMPFLIPLLFSDRFNEVISVAQIMMLGMIPRAISLPVEYMPLAKGEPMTHLLMESIYCVLLAVCVCMGYHFAGLLGSGIGFTLTQFVSMIFNIVFVKMRYL